MRNASLGTNLSGGSSFIISRGKSRLIYTPSRRYLTASRCPRLFNHGKFIPRWKVIQFPITGGQAITGRERGGARVFSTVLFSEQIRARTRGRGIAIKTIS